MTAASIPNSEIVLSRADYEVKRTAPTRYVVVTLPTGGKAKLRSLSELEQANYEAELIQINNRKASKDGKLIMHKDRLSEARRRLIALCLVDGTNQRVFRDDEVDAVGQLDSADAFFLATSIRAHLGADKEYFEELVKNSEEIHVVDSPSN